MIPELCICLLAVCSENMVVSCCSPTSLQIYDIPVLEMCLCCASLGFGCFAIPVVQCPWQRVTSAFFVPLCTKAQSWALELEDKSWEE